MTTYNKVFLIGNLTRDPEMRQLPSGQSICRLGIATNRQFKNKQTGAVTQEVCFIDVDVWGAQAESCRQFLQKGKQVLIEGRIKYDQWKDQSGQNKSKHSIVADSVQFLGGFSAKLDENSLPASTTDDNSPTLPADKTEDAFFKGARKGEGRTKKDKDPAAFNTGEVDYTDMPPFNNEPPF